MTERQISLLNPLQTYTAERIAETEGPIAFSRSNKPDSSGRHRMTTDLMRIDFHGETILLIEKDGEPFVPIRQVCEKLGLSWPTQFRKLKAGQRPWRVAFMATQLPGDNQKREIVCLPLSQLHGWFFTLTPSKVSPELRDKLKIYQKECLDVLWQHWSGQKRQVEADLYDRVCQAETEAEKLRALILAEKPLWSKIERYRQLGFSDLRIYRLISKTREEIADLITMLEDLGILSKARGIKNSSFCGIYLDEFSEERRKIRGEVQ